MLDLADVKQCTRCGEVKPVGLFHFKAGRKSRRPRCKTCESAYAYSWYLKNKDRHDSSGRAWKAKNKDRISKLQREWRDRNRLKVRILGVEQQRKRKYGVSREKYKEMLKASSGLCAICHQSFEGWPNIDHDHSTGAVRELLCRYCNQGLGHFRDSISIMEAAIAYLKKHGGAA